MPESSFGDRLRTAFQNANNAQIARKIGVGPSTVVNYMAGRIPDLPIVFKIKEVTDCDLNWLLTGEESRGVGLRISKAINEKLAEIAKEQAPIAFADAEIGANLENRATNLLADYLIDESLMNHNLTTAPLMSKADRKRASKFTFVANREPTIEETFRKIVVDEITRLQLGAEGDVTIEPADRVAVPDWGKVNEDEVPEKIRKTG